MFILQGEMGTRMAIPQLPGPDFDTFLKDQLWTPQASSKWSNSISEGRIRRKCGHMLSASRAANKQL
jgi:hypothetical protein